MLYTSLAVFYSVFMMAYCSMKKSCKKIVDVQDQNVKTQYLCICSLLPEGSALHLSVLNFISLIPDCSFSLSKAFRILTPFSEVLANTSLQLGVFRFDHSLPYSGIQVINTAANRNALTTHVHSAFLV